MFEITRGDPKTTERRWRAIYGKEKLTAEISCPMCGKGIRISGEIEDDGEVRAPVTCWGSECGFVETVRLKGWGWALDRFTPL